MYHKMEHILDSPKTFPNSILIIKLSLHMEEQEHCLNVYLIVILENAS
jgi:hypothetical protein